MSGATAIVGARFNDAFGSTAGSAYLFDVATGQELIQLAASDPVASAQFGFAVAMDGNKAIVGAHGTAAAGFGTGSAYVFDVTTQQQLFKLDASDPAQNDRLGISVGISGSAAIAGAYLDEEDPFDTDPGAAYLFNVGAPCAADIDGSGDVGFSEILAILSTWGCTDCPEDLDGSGDVGFADLLIVLSSWGPCE